MTRQPLPSGGLLRRIDEATRRMLKRQKDREAAATSHTAKQISDANQVTAALAAANRTLAEQQAASDRARTEANETLRLANDNTADMARRRMALFLSSGRSDRPRQFTASAATVSGSATFRMTEDGTAGGAAIFAQVMNVQAAVNDPSTLYTFGWVISADLKTITVSVRRSATPALALLGINILAAPAAVPNGTVIQLLVTGQ